MKKMLQEIQLVEQAIVSRSWDGDLRKCHFDTDWQGRKNKNYKITFHLKHPGRRVDLSVSLEYVQRRENTPLCYLVQANLMNGRNFGRHADFDRALTYFLGQVAGGFEELKEPEVAPLRGARGRRRGLDVAISIQSFAA